METHEYKGKVIKIVQDDCPQSPREDDNLGTMYCFHKRYTLGDEHTLSLDDAMAIEKNPNYLWLPIYMLDHSGLAISTLPFSCPWDSGRLGIIAVPLSKVREEYSAKRVTKQLRERVLGYLQSEVETYNQYLQGDVYGYEIDDDDTYFGFYGEDAALSEAKSVIDSSGGHCGQ